MSYIGTSSFPGSFYNTTGSTNQWYNPLQEVYLRDDFTCGGNNSTGELPWQLTNNWTTGVSGQIATNHPGVISLDIANGDETKMGLSGQNCMKFGGGTIDCYWVTKLSNLSDGTDRYQVQIGFGYGVSTNDSAAFLYQDNVNSGNWQITSQNGGSATTTNTSTAATTNWTTFRVNINAAASLITYYINGTSVGTINSNISTNVISPSCSFKKLLGTTARKLYIDYFYLYQKMTTSR